MPRRFREDFSSDSELADSTIDPFEQQSETELDHPTPISLSDSDAPSPSLYRKERAQAAAAPPIVQKIDRNRKKKNRMTAKQLRWKKEKVRKELLCLKVVPQIK